MYEFFHLIRRRSSQYNDNLGSQFEYILFLNRTWNEFRGVYINDIPEFLADKGFLEEKFTVVQEKKKRIQTS